MLIYMIENILNGKFYIGKTVRTVQVRFKQHIQCAKKRINRKLYDAMNHYGIDKFVVHVIEDNIQSEDILNEREIYWITKLNATKYGYNMAEGGQGGASIVPKHWNEKHHRSFHDYLYNRGGRELMSKRMKENNPMKGKKHSKETREKISKIVKKYRREHPELFKGPNNPMYGYTKEYVETHKNKSELCKKLSKAFQERSKRFSGKGNPMYGRNDQCYGARRWNAEVKGKTAEEIYGVEWAKERAEKQSDAMKKLWKDENYRQRRHEQSKERGKIISESLKEYNKRNAKTCPYCGKTVSPTNFLRWHGERCKNKNIGEL